MTIKECIDGVDNIKPNQYSIRDKVLWLSFIDEIIINDMLKAHEGYDGRYDDFVGYSEDKLSMPLIVPSPYDRLYTAYLKMKIDGENGETARYNNSAAMFNTYMMEYRKYYNKTHMPLNKGHKNKTIPPKPFKDGLTEAEFENLKKELYYLLSDDFAEMTSNDKLYAIVTNYMNTNAAMLKGKDGLNGVDGKNGYTPRKGIDYFDGEKGEKGDPGEQGIQGITGLKGDKGDDGYTPQKGVDYFTDEDIAGLNIPSVDQTFNPESENAQSGKAVAEAVTTEQKRSDNTFANALKGSKSGSAILIDDVSPVAHEISVVLGVGGATVAKYGKNLAPSTFNFNDIPGLSITDNGDGSISIKGTVAQNSYSPLIENFVLPRGTYCVSGIFPSDWAFEYGYALIDGNYIYTSTKVITLSERKMVSLSIVLVAGVQYDLVIRPQIEVGTTSTEWEKYKEPIIYTADESGNVSGIVGNGNDITLTTNDEVEISVKYNKDINKMFTKLTQAIISLGGNV